MVHLADDSATNFQATVPTYLLVNRENTESGTADSGSAWNLLSWLVSPKPAIQALHQPRHALKKHHHPHFRNLVTELALSVGLPRTNIIHSEYGVTRTGTRTLLSASV